jgi:hypothetical protein
VPVMALPLKMTTVAVLSVYTEKLWSLASSLLLKLTVTTTPFGTVIVFLSNCKFWAVRSIVTAVGAGVTVGLEGVVWEGEAGGLEEGEGLAVGDEAGGGTGGKGEVVCGVTEGEELGGAEGLAVGVSGVMVALGKVVEGAGMGGSAGTVVGVQPAIHTRAIRSKTANMNTTLCVTDKLSCFTVLSLRTVQPFSPPLNNMKKTYDYQPGVRG